MHNEDFDKTALRADVQADPSLRRAHTSFSIFWCARRNFLWDL